VAGAQVKFSDKSTGSPTGWLWDFGDGTISYEQNPSHVYQNPGAYTISLIANTSSASSKATKKVKVYGSKTSSSSVQSIELVPDFNVSPSTPEVGMAVQFTDSSTGNPASWSWDFGDGSQGSGKNPQHSYQASGALNIKLTISNGAQSKSVTRPINVLALLTPDFSFSPGSPKAGDYIQFQDSSAGNPTSWSWDFGDGSKSMVKNPQYAYSQAGTYSATLSVSNGYYTKSIAKTIVVNPVIQADFGYSPTNPVVGTSIQFSDKSSGNITTWSWKFGDSGTSSLKNPTHAYSAAGTYNVTLTVSDGASSNSMTQTVTVTTSIVAGFSFDPASPVVNQQVQFLDSTQGTPTSWSWDFGDAATSTSKNPTHTYSQAGTYTVKLTASDGTNSSAKIKSLTVSSPSSSKVITATSCALADVQAAIATAKAGDTVVVPNGTVTWGSQLYITKGITLKAASVGGVTIIAGFEGKNWGSDNFLIRFQPQDPANNKTFRLSGFKLDCNNKVDAILLVNTSTTEEINQVRIDHNEISNLQTDINARYLETDGLIWGVADNNIFHNDDTDAVYRTWQALGYNGGQSIWQNHPFNFGSEKQFYFEDNTFYTKNILVGCGGGGRYCLRHNDIIVKRNSIITVYMFDLHGNMGSGQNWGGIGCELYDNRIDMGNNGLNLIDARGGKALIYNNTISNLGQYQSVYYQVREEYNDSLNPPAKHSVSGQPQYVSETYFFNQVINGSKPLPPNVNVTQTIDYGGSEGIVPREDFNYFREKASFDGSSGVGVGPVSQRPAYCSKEGVVWWATDENKLYRWHNGTWELYYTPYTYPHPLRNRLND
jgi:PKD repeat protein